MKKIFNNPIFTFVLGAIIFGTTGVIAATLMATNVSYSNTNSGINANNVQDAIDSLYTKANTTYEEYNGTTTYTPTTSTQTVATNNKLMKSNITINPIPSSYKNLSTITTATANYISSGKTAYDNNGNLITGTSLNNCIKGNFTLNSNCTTSSGQMVIQNFTPRVLYLERVDKDLITMYNLDKDNNYQTFFGNTTTKVQNPWANLFEYKSGSLYMHNMSSEGNVGSTVYYIACS